MTRFLLHLPTSQIKNKSHLFPSKHSPKAPWRRSLRSAFIIVSFVNISRSTYSVRCSSGAKVTGDFFSHCRLRSASLYIPVKQNRNTCQSYRLKTSSGRGIFLQLSKTVEQCCSSKGNFWRFIQQYSVALIRVEMITVPSGETEVRMSFSAVPRMSELRSLARNTWGTHRTSLRDCSPMMGSVRLGATFLNTNRESTYRSCSRAWILNCCGEMILIDL